MSTPDAEGRLASRRPSEPLDRGRNPGGGPTSSSSTSAAAAPAREHAPQRAAAPPARSARLRRCLGDGALIVAFYATYASIRNMQGGRMVPHLEAQALAHGLTILDIERRLLLAHEATVQTLFLSMPWLMKASNIFYATAHFIVTAVVLFALTFTGGREHRRWRNILGLSTGLALVGFAIYPTMPPRLLPDHPALIDTLQEIGGFWSFQTPAIERIADPFAAMPSLHMVWAAWVASAIWHRLRHRWTKVLAVGYPVVTAVVVVATANHYLLDLLAGLAVLGLAWFLVTAIEGWRSTSPAGSEADPRSTTS